MKLAAFVSGLLFAIGLCVSGMTLPSKVTGFLDFTGDWDPSLAFVMMGAIGVHLFFARRALVAKRPVFATTFHFPSRKDVDRELLAGAAIFGVGWGLGGYCPGPALVSVVAHAAPTVVFVAAMAASIVATRFILARRKDDAPASSRLSSPCG